VNILIATTPGRETWLADCVASFKQPVTIRSDFSFELGKIKWAYENTNWDRWWLIQDSVVIKDPQFLVDGWDMQSSVAINQSPAPFGMYLGIYSRKTLDKMEIPLVNTKQESITYEISWNKEYCLNENVLIMFPEFNDSRASGTKERHGRVNLVLENDYLIKYKSTWA
jgi:hypothetical protein